MRLALFSVAMGEARLQQRQHFCRRLRQDVCVTKEALVGGDKIISLCAITPGQDEVVLKVFVQGAELLGIVEVRHVGRHGRGHLAHLSCTIPGKGPCCSNLRFGKLPSLPEEPFRAYARLRVNVERAVGGICKGNLAVNGAANKGLGVFPSWTIEEKQVESHTGVYEDDGLARTHGATVPSSRVSHSS